MVEERLFTKAGKVTVGASPKNDIFMSTPSLPRSFCLFEHGKEAWRLRCAPGMDGRVSYQGQVLTLAEAARGGHPDAGGVTGIPLSESQRGKVKLGEVTILFQFVDPPPVQPKPQLPPSVRGGVFNSLDWVMACCFVTVFMVHGGALAYMRTLDFPVNPGLDPIVVATTYGIIPEKERPILPDLEAVIKKGEDPVKPKPKPVVKRSSRGNKGKAGPGKAKPACDKACKEAEAAKRRARLAKKMKAVAETMIFGVKGKGGGTVRDLLQKGNPGQEMAKAFDGMNGVEMTSVDKLASLKARGAGGTGKVIKGGRIDVLGPEQVDTGVMVKERVPTAKVKSLKPEFEVGKLGADATYRIIRSGMRCVQNTYQRHLKKDRELSGKLSLCLTVDPLGRVGQVDVEEDAIGSRSLTTGVSGCLRRLRFPPPSGGGVAEVCVPFLLQPAK